MKIESLDKANAMKLIDVLNQDLKALGEKYGVSLRINGGKIVTDQAATFKLEATIEGTGSVRQQRTSDALELYAKAYLPNIDISKPIKHPRLGSITICGWNTKAYKTPVLAKAEKDGKTYRFDVASILALVK